MGNGRCLFAGSLDPIKRGLGRSSTPSILSRNPTPTGGVASGGCCVPTGGVASGGCISPQRTFVQGLMDSTNRRYRIAGGLIPIDVQEGDVAGWLRVTEAMAGRQHRPLRPPSIQSTLSTLSILSRNPTPPGGVAAPDGKARLRRGVAVVSRQARASGD